jgi:Undecaprenyl-phosphate galactose phosphotransferase WbaP
MEWGVSEHVVYNETLLPSRWSIVQARVVRRYVYAITFILSDVMAFAVGGFLFRDDQVTPKLLFYEGISPLQGAIDIFYVLAALFILVRFLLGDYTKRQLFWDSAGQTTVSLLLASLPCLLLLVVDRGLYSSTVVVFSWAFVILAVPLLRQVTRWLLSKFSYWWLPTALIGDGERLRDSFGIFSEALSLGFDVRFLVSAETPEFVTGGSKGLAHIPLQEPVNIANILEQAGCLKAVFASDEVFSARTSELIQRLMVSGIDVVVVPPLNQMPMLGMTMDYAFGRDLLLLHFRNNLLRLPSRVCKRAFDIAGSMALLLLLSPMFLVIAWMIARADGGSPFFIQKRVGRKGSTFSCIKFRTMRVDAETLLSRWKAENSPFYREYVENNFKLRNDPRISPVGGWLRCTSLDELPQLFNVLLGEMSLVGPRPLIPREVSIYGPSIELYKQTRPGITGLWQISGRSETTFDNRVSCDGWYIRNWSFWYDLVILIKTVGVLLERKGAY